MTDGPRVLAVRLDSDGDVLMTGPAVTALRCGPDGLPADRVDLLASPSGAAAAHLLPGVDDVLVADVPWSGHTPPAPDAGALTDLVERVRAGAYDEVVVFTSYHQSPLPMALVARMAGVARVCGASEDYPGTLLDVRHRRDGAPDGTGGQHEVLAALALVADTGRAVPACARLAVREDLPGLARSAPDLAARLPRDGFVVVHPGASVPARAPAPGVARSLVRALRAAGSDVVVTGSPAERDLAAFVADAPATGAVDAAGTTDLAGLAQLLRRAAAVVVGNTGPAHLAAAVGTPVASLFSAVMPVERWAPFGVPTVLLGDRTAPCRLTRAQRCPVPGHPCLDVDPDEVVAAVADLVAGRVEPLPAAAGPVPPRRPGSEQAL